MADFSEEAFDEEMSSLSFIAARSPERVFRSLATSATSILMAFLSEARSPGAFLSVEGALDKSAFSSTR